MRRYWIALAAALGLAGLLALAAVLHHYSPAYRSDEAVKASLLKSPPPQAVSAEASEASAAAEASASAAAEASEASAASAPSAAASAVAEARHARHHHRNAAPPEIQPRPPAPLAELIPFPRGSTGSAPEAIVPIPAPIPTPTPAPTPALATPPQATRRLPNVVSILYGTDRARSGAMPIDYTGERGGRLELGVVDVSVPKRHVPGKVERPSLLMLDITEDPAKHFVISRQPQVLSDDQFVQLARQRDQRRSALLFVHGYNQDFDDGLYRTAQLAYDFQIHGPVFYYSWPSRKNAIEYDYDADSSRQSQFYLEAFLKLIMQRAGVTRLSIVAHSHGNDLVLNTLKNLAAEQDGLPAGCCAQLIMASPDIETSYAAQLIAPITPHFQGVTLYANNNDVALFFSNRKAGDEPRLGELQRNGWPLLLPGMDSIDATAVPFSIFDFNHNAYVASTVLLQDIDKLIAVGLRPPDHRSKRLVLVRVPMAPGQYWRLSP